LEDPTGARRFLPIRIVHAIDLERLSADVGQLIGEAAHMVSNGEPAKLPQDVWAIAAEVRAAATKPSRGEVQLEDWFGGEAPGLVRSAALGQLIEAAKLRISDGNLGAIMRKLKFTSEYWYLPVLNGKPGEKKKTRVWARGEREAAEANAYTIRLTGPQPSVIVPSIEAPSTVPDLLPALPPLHLCSK
jgi:predicted P-loop ATPase